MNFHGDCLLTLSGADWQGEQKLSCLLERLRQRACANIRMQAAVQSIVVLCSRQLVYAHQVKGTQTCQRATCPTARQPQLSLCAVTKADKNRGLTSAHCDGIKQAEVHAAVLQISKLRLATCCHDHPFGAWQLYLISTLQCTASARPGSPSECPVVVMLPTSSPYAASSFRTATCTWPCARRKVPSLYLSRNHQCHLDPHITPRSGAQYDADWDVLGQVPMAAAMSCDRM